MTGAGRGRVCAVVFDLWNTLVPYPVTQGVAALTEIARLLGANPDALEAAAREGFPLMRASLEDGLREISRRLRIGAPDATVAAAARAWRERHAKLLVPRADALSTLTELRRIGLRTGLLTNCSSDLPEAWEGSELASHIDAAVFSCLDGVTKPDPGSYALVATRLGLLPRQCAFVGDTAEELFGAQNAGMRPLLLRTEDERASREWSGEYVSSLGGVVNRLVTRSHQRI